MRQDEMRLCCMKAEIIKAVGHPLRLAIVEFLASGERCVCEIAEQIGADRSNVSRHLALMVRAGVLENRKAGLQVYYRLRTPCLLNFLKCVDTMLREQVDCATALLKVK